MNHHPEIRLAAIVVTRNRLDQLKTTVNRLLKENVDHVVVVDNASTDGTLAWLAEHGDTRLCLAALDQNVGGAGGFEAGIRLAVDRFDPDWCVVMDDDARPAEGAFDVFRDMAQRTDFADWDAYSAAVYFPDGKICEMNRPSRNPFWSGRDFLRTLGGGGRAGFHLPDSAYDADHLTEIDAASFVGLFLSRQAIDKNGYPEGDLFIYGDDVMYTLQLRKSGGRIAFEPGLRFEHDTATYDNDEARVHRHLWKVYYNYRNSLLAYRLAAGPVLFWPVLLVALVKWMVKSVRYGAERGIYLRLFLLAVRDALSQRRDRSFRQIRARIRLAEMTR